MVSRSLEERIAELNRQSTEARDKLLQLIDQQKSAAADMVPPMLSPVPTPSLNYPGKYPASGETKTNKTVFFLLWRVLILLDQWLWLAVHLVLMTVWCKHFLLQRAKNVSAKPLLKLSFYFSLLQVLS